jgi:hypothetical protein
MMVKLGNKRVATFQNRPAFRWEQRKTRADLRCSTSGSRPLARSDCLGQFWKAHAGNSSRAPKCYLAKELGAHGIAVNTVAPGAIATDFSGGMVRDNPEVNKRVADMTALGRVGQPDDIGPMIASLLSEENRWINGQRIEVSGGMNL